MTGIRAAGELLTASADDRTLSYLLLPYGEQGRTNKGRVIASAGTLTLPERLVANLEHDEKRPVAWSTNLEETDRGLEATFTVAETTAGNDLIAEAAAGLRTGVSVEIDPVVIRNGKLVAGTLTGAGFVTKPAFPSARLVAEDAGELEDDAEDDENDEDQDDDGEPAGDADTTPPAGDNHEENNTVPPSARAAAGGLAARKAGGNDKLTASEFYNKLAAAHAAGGVSGLRAALADIVPANTLGLEVPAYVGELWSGRAYQRRIVPLLNHANLTSYEVRGWRWTTKPAVAPYTGSKAEVPSNAVATEAVVLSAERLAGAHDIDRKYRDFNDSEFFAAYNRAMTESYAEQSDAEVLAALLADATAVTAGTVPTGVAPGLVSVVDGALAVLSATRATPTFALVANDLWRDIMFTPHESALEYLNASMGLEEGSLSGFRIMPEPSLTAGQTLVGTKSAATVHELGTVPIRVEAENIANGGVDVGVFGYLATNVHSAEGLALVTPAA